MPNIAALLKTEIARLARKEVRTAVQALQKASVEQRRLIMVLKKELGALRKAQQGTSRRNRERETPTQDTLSSESQLRWRPAGFAQHRKRLGLSAAQMASLVGCSPLSIYKWESGKVRPRAAQLHAIAKVRKLSRAEAQRLVQTQSAGAAAPTSQAPSRN